MNQLTPREELVRRLAAAIRAAELYASGHPLGFSVALWTAAMLALDLADRRTMWRGYWLEWAIAALLLLANEAAEWRVAQVMGASLPFLTVVPPLLISVLAFPIIAWIVSRLDRWRLGR